LLEYQNILQLVTLGMLELPI